MPGDSEHHIVASVEKMVNEDRSLNVREIEERLGLSRGTVHSILTDRLGMSKVCDRWIPSFLSQDDKAYGVAASRRLKSRRRHDLRRPTSSGCFISVISCSNISVILRNFMYYMEKYFCTW